MKTLFAHFAPATLVQADNKENRRDTIRNPEGRRLFNLQLGPLTLALAGATGKNDLAQIRNLQKKHGAGWLNYWLSEQGASL